MTPTDQTVIFSRLDFNVRFVQTGRTVEVTELHQLPDGYWGWEKVDTYLSRAKTPGGLMRSASRWLAFHRYEQLELFMPEQGAEVWQAG